MQIAVITPVYQTPRAWLEECLASVARQTVPCTHFLINDGDAALSGATFPGVQFLQLPEPHGDNGNAARAIGSISAIARDFDAIAYLNGDNWFEPDHVEQLVQLQQRTKAAVCTSARNLCDLEGRLLGRCPEVDGEKFVDTSCLFLTRSAFGIVTVWYRMPRSFAPVCDRIVWQAIKDEKLSRAHHPVPTCNFRTNYRTHYEYFGKTPPPGAKQVVITSSPTRQMLSCTTSVQTTADAPQTDVAPKQRSARVSLCMIVKNEEANLGDCLAPLENLFDEIIVVDTGSKDRTREVATRHGAKVFEFPWVDSFAAARNESLLHATGEWIFWLDADDRFDEVNREKLSQLLRDLPQENNAYMMRQWSVPDERSGSALIVDHARLFRRQSQVRWRYRIHEQILLPLREVGAKLVWTDIVIRHLGYQEPSQRHLKRQRNLRLLHLELTEQPKDSFTLFNLAGTYIDDGQMEQAVPYLQGCLEHAPNGVTYLPKAYALLTRSCHLLGRDQEALRYCQEGRQRFPDDAELLFEEGSILQARGELAKARPCFEKILTLGTKASFVGMDADLTGCRTRHNLALVYRGLGMMPQAEEQWRIATKQTPEFGPAWLGLVELNLEQQRRPVIDALLQRLEGKPYRDAILPALQARLALTKDNDAIARNILEKAIARTPDVLWLRLLLTEILMRVSKDEKAAEQQLRAILDLDPQQKQARQKLDQLLAKQAKSS